MRLQARYLKVSFKESLLNENRRMDVICVRQSGRQHEAHGMKGVNERGQSKVPELNLITGGTYSGTLL